MNTEGQQVMRKQTVNQMGADVAVQVMLMMLFACMSQFADRADALQKQLRERLLDITEEVTLPPGSEHLEQEVRRAARDVISNVFVGVSAISFPGEET
jgi:hypothetical protein